MDHTDLIVCSFMENSIGPKVINIHFFFIIWYTEFLQCKSYSHLGRIMRFPTMWYVRPAKAQTSLRICAV